MRVWLGIVAALLLALGAGLYLARDRIALGLLQAAAERGMAHDELAALPDGLTAGFCGTGSPMPDRARAGPCLAVVAGGRLFVFDAGEGAAETLALMGLAPARIEAVFLTHFHSDHIDGLGGLALQRWATGAAAAPLPLYGPDGVTRVAAGFNEAYALDAGHRVAHHGEAVTPPAGAGLVAHAFALGDAADASVLAFDDGGVRITAFRVDHGPVQPAVGYRIDYKGRSIVVSGDTNAAASLRAHARGADLMISDALAPNLVALMHRAAREAQADGVAQILADIPDYHASPEAAAALAAEAEVGALALTHIIPPLPHAIFEGPFLGAARQRFTGPLWVMRDGDLIILPAAGGMSRRNSLR